MQKTVHSARHINPKRVLLYCACVFLCTCAASFEIDNSSVAHLQPNSMLAIGMLVASMLLFWRIFTKECLKPRLVVIVIALLFGLFTVLGMQLDAGRQTLVLVGLVVSTKEIASPMVCYAAMFTAFVGYSLFYCAAISLLYEKLSTLSPKNDGPHATIFKQRITFPICIAILLIAWLPYIIYFFPGMPSSDTSRQIAQLFGTNGLTLDTHFPYLTSVLFGGLYRLGCSFDTSGYLGVFLMTMAQTALGIFVFSTVVVWLDRLGANRKLVIGTLLFFALFPLIPVYTVKIEKDTLHAELLVLLTLQIILLFKFKHTEEKAPWLASPLAIGIVCLFVALTRNNGIFLVVAALAVTAILASSKKLWVVLAGVVTACCVWQIVLLPLFGVTSEGPREALSMPAQIVAAHLYNELPLDEQDRLVLDKTCGNSLDDMKVTYNSDFADTSKGFLTIESGEDMATFLGAVAHISMQHPMRAISAALSTSYGTWYPFCYGTYHCEDHPFLNPIDDSGWANFQWFDSFEDAPCLEQRAYLGSTVLHRLHYVPVLATLYTPGFYLWLAMLIVGFSIYRKQQRRLTLSVFAVFFLLSLIMVFGPCSSLRYSLPYVFSLPLFVYILLECLPHDSRYRASFHLMTNEES